MKHAGQPNFLCPVHLVAWRRPHIGHLPKQHEHQGREGSGGEEGVGGDERHGQRAAGRLY